MVNTFSRFPRSIMNANRKELSDLKMQIEGKLPNDLQGHVFIFAPAGTVTSKGLPFDNGDPFLNGDGMIYRFGFDRQGEVQLKTRLVKPPDYWADEAIQDNELLKFNNHGIIRFSYLLGARNELNTAFLPMKFPGESNERLLVTYDAGRPYEIDTETLELVTPVGAMSEWEAAIDWPKYPFSPILSTAHPAFDTYNNQMFTVNYGRSLLNLIGIIRDKLDQENNRFLMTRRAIVDEQKEKKRLLVLELLGKIVLNNLWSNDFVHLVRWDGVGSLERWKLINPDGSPVKIWQSMHQIGLSEDYVVLMDTSFVTGVEQVIANLPDFPFIAERKLVALRPSPDSTLYIVRRDDLQQGRKEVVAQKVVIPLEACHFLVDYENPDNKITLHIAHICAWDVAEWLRNGDRSPYDNRPVPRDLVGTQQNEMDISRMGRYVIDANTLENNEPPKVISDPVCTWGPGLFAYLDRLPSSGMTPSKLDNIYWVSFGLCEEVMTKFMYDQYKDYKYREVPLEQVLELAKQGIPACLYRLHTSSNASMAIADYYKCDQGYIMLSPQFVPRLGGEESSTNGYIVCTTFTPERDEIWIFDAANLKQGPLCKLHHPELNFGLSLHTAWLRNISSHQAKYNIPVRQDHQDLVINLLDVVDDFSSLTHSDKEQLKQEIKDLFEQKVYPHFE